VRWIDENQSLKPTNYKTTVILQVSQDLHKIPTFYVPKFQGDILTCDNFISDVNRAFRSATMTQFLDSPSCGNNSLTRSDAFASRLHGSVADLDILGCLVTELDPEKNCAKVWTRIHLKLNSSDITSARIMSNWQALFALKRKYRDSCLSCYFKRKSALHKIKRSNSIVVTDDVFLKAFFAKAISIDEL